MIEIKFKYYFLLNKKVINTKTFIMDDIEDINFNTLLFLNIDCNKENFDKMELHRKQYTGLKDKNGVEIYEGDIVSFTLFDCFDNDMQHIGKILFNNGAFYIEYMDKYELYNSLLCYVISQDDEFEVIGNICENSDVLKG